VYLCVFVVLCILYCLYLSVLIVFYWFGSLLCFLKILFCRYPHIVFVCEEIARRHSADYDYESAVRFSRSGLSLMLRMVKIGVMYETRDLISQWEILKDNCRKNPFLSSTGYYNFLNGQALRTYSLWMMEPNPDDDDPDAILFKQMMIDLRRIQSRRLEKWGNILMVYLSYFVIFFLLIRCIYESKCDGIGQDGK